MEDLSGFSMLELFRLEAETQTAALSAGVLAIETLEHSPAAIESMMRAAHSLKGAARIIGLEPAVRVAHAMEEVFVAAGSGLFKVRAEHADVLLEGIDFLASIARAGDALAPEGPWTASADALVARLAAIHGAPHTPPPAPEPSTSEQPPLAAPPAFEPVDRVVRVSADSLTRLVALTGESLVEARQLRHLVDGLLALRGLQTKLCNTVARLGDRSHENDRLEPETGGNVAATLREQADAMRAGLSRHFEAFESYARRTENLSSRLHHEVIASRMRPFADGIRGFPRLVRDLARSLGKHVRLEIRGDQTGVDRDILEKLEAPLSISSATRSITGSRMPDAARPWASPVSAPFSSRRGTVPARWSSR